jgi:uncharacterized protein
MTNENPVRWFEIYVQDMKRAKAFYGAVLGVEFMQLEAPGMDMWAFPMLEKADGASGSLVKMEGVPSGGNSTVVYFGCDDCGVEAGRVEQAGGKIFQPKFSIGQYGFCALAVDTEGNMFGLHSTK